MTCTISYIYADVISCLGGERDRDLAIEVDVEVVLVIGGGLGDFEFDLDVIVSFLNECYVDGTYLLVMMGDVVLDIGFWVVNEYCCLRCRLIHYH